MIRPYPKQGPRVRVKRYRTPRCIIRGCNRPQVMDELCKSHARAEQVKQLSLEVRSLGRCELRGMDKVRCGGVLQAAHIFPKGAYPAIKFDRENLLCICAGHHRYYTERWPDWRAIVLRLVGQDRFDRVWGRSGA